MLKSLLPAAGVCRWSPGWRRLVDGVRWRGRILAGQSKAVGVASAGEIFDAADFLRALSTHISLDCVSSGRTADDVGRLRATRRCQASALTFGVSHHGALPIPADSPPHASLPEEARSRRRARHPPNSPARGHQRETERQGTAVETTTEGQVDCSPWDMRNANLQHSRHLPHVPARRGRRDALHPHDVDVGV